MKRELIETLWREATQNDEDYNAILKIFETEKLDTEYLLDEAVVKFTKALLFEAAKIVCVDCKINGPSEPLSTRDPTSRIHTMRGAKGYETHGACRAVWCYLEEGPSAKS